MDISKILTFSDLGMSIKIYLFNIRPFSQSKGSVTTKYPSKHTTILTGHKTLLQKDYIGMLKWVLDEMSQIIQNYYYYNKRNSKCDDGFVLSETIESFFPLLFFFSFFFFLSYILHDMLNI